MYINFIYCIEDEKFYYYVPSFIKQKKCIGISILTNNCHMNQVGYNIIYGCDCHTKITKKSIKNPFDFKLYGRIEKYEITRNQFEQKSNMDYFEFRNLSQYEFDKYIRQFISIEKEDTNQKVKLVVNTKEKKNNIVQLYINNEKQKKYSSFLKKHITININKFFNQTQYKMLLKLFSLFGCEEYIKSSPAKNLCDYISYVKNNSAIEILYKSNLFKNIKQIECIENLNSKGKNIKEIFRLSNNIEEDILKQILKGKQKPYSYFRNSSLDIHNIIEGMVYCNFQPTFYSYESSFSRCIVTNNIKGLYDNHDKLTKDSDFKKYFEEYIEETIKYSKGKFSYSKSLYQNFIPLYNLIKNYGYNKNKLYKYLFNDLPKKQYIFAETDKIEKFLRYSYIAISNEFEYEKYPSSLILFFNRLLKYYDEKKDEILKKNFIEASKKNSKLNYYKDDISIISPKKPEDLKREGDLMHHCVANYINKYAQGESLIFFLRKNEDIDKPWITIEILNLNNKYSLAQAYRAYDVRISQEELDIIMEWINSLNEKTKETEKNLNLTA